MIRKKTIWFCSATTGDIGRTELHELFYRKVIEKAVFPTKAAASKMRRLIVRKFPEWKTKLYKAYIVIQEEK